MPSSLNGTGVTFNDGTTLQSGAIPAANLGSGTANSTTFLRGDRTFATVPPTPPAIEILNTQIFTASGTWTKPAVSANDTLILAVIGGGGSGGTVTSGSAQTGSAGGGAGGGVLLANFRIGDLASTIGVTVGGGGASRTGTGPGPSGGTSSFGGLVNATGGGGGFGAVNATISPGGNAGEGNLSGNQTEGGLNSFASIGRTGRSDATPSTTIAAGLTGGGGANGHASSTQRTQNRPGGTGRLFGDGGAGNITTAGGGSVPGGGGGGASRNAAGPVSGAGARGEVRCFVVRGRFSASAFFGID